MAVEQPRKNTDRDALEQDDLQHLAVDRGCLQVEQLAKDSLRCLRLIEKVVMQVLHLWIIIVRSDSHALRNIEIRRARVERLLRGCWGILLLLILLNALLWRLLCLLNWLFLIIATTSSGNEGYGTLLGKGSLGQVCCLLRWHNCFRCLLR